MVHLAIVATASVWVVAPSGPLAVVVSSPADHLMVSLHLASIAEVVQKHGDPVGYWRLVGLGMRRAGEEDEGVGNHSPLRPGTGAATPPRILLPAARNENPALARPQRPDLEQLREL